MHSKDPNDAFANLIVLYFITGVATDRFVAIIFPLHYNIYITPKRSAIAAIGYSLILFIVSGLPFVGVNTWSPGTPCIVYYVYPHLFIKSMLTGWILLGLSIITVLYGIMFRAVHKQQMRIDTSTNDQANEDKDKKNKIRRFLSNTRTARKLGAVIVVFAVCLLPYLISLLIILQDVDWYMDNVIMQYVEFLSIILALMNSGVNPIIYAINMSEFRSAFLRLLRIRKTELEMSTQQTQFTA